MVGAYAAQKVAENDKVQQMSGKVLTIIEQKLDSYIEDGIKEAEDKVEKKIDVYTEQDGWLVGILKRRPNGSPFGLKAPPPPCRCWPPSPC